VDIITGSSGAKTSIPLNSGPFTPFELVEFRIDYPDYLPSQEFQNFDISFNFKEDAVLDRPVLGGLSISLVPEAQAEELTTVKSSVVATFAYIPATGLNLDQYKPELEVSVPSISQRAPDFFPLNLLPDFPFLQNHGDIRLDYDLANTGNIFLEVVSETNVQQLNILGQSEKSVFTESLESFLIPDQKLEQTVDIQPTESDPVLGVGIYVIDLTTKGEIGEQVGTTESSQQILVIFPWKQSIFVLGLLVVFRRRIAASIRGLLGYLQAFKEFRSSRKQKAAPGEIIEPKPEPSFSIPVAISNTQSTTSEAKPSNDFIAPLKSALGKSKLLIGMLRKNLKKATFPKVKIRLPKITRKAKPVKTENPSSFASKSNIEPQASKLSDSVKPFSVISPPTPKTSNPAPKNPQKAKPIYKSEPRPLYPYWYEPPKKGDSN
jgi:hypothetical protein